MRPSQADSESYSRLQPVGPVIESWMAESTLDLISSHVASGARLMARQKQIVAELKAKGVDIDEAERTLATLSACLRVFEKQWLAILNEQDDL
jgi:hypothetical protein